VDELLAQARLELAQDAPAEAIELLRAPLAVAESNGLIGDTVRFLVVLAVAHERLGHFGRAVAVLERALDLAEPGGYVRTFLDDDPPVACDATAARVCTVATAGARRRPTSPAGRPGCAKRT
jgi:LuxR family maltose regulon positive regulatory protein